jgi:hypothetical protein
MPCQSRGGPNARCKTLGFGPKDSLGGLQKHHRQGNLPLELTVPRSKANKG